MTPGDPVYLPFGIQHRLFVKVQCILEKACFGFAQKHLGGVLQREGWDCAEAVELNRWPEIFLTYESEFNLRDVEDIGKSFSKLLDSIIQLRHTAVHRVRLTADGALQSIVDAELFAKLLRDYECLAVITTIKQQMHEIIQELEQMKSSLKLKLAEIRSQFADKKAELDRQESQTLEAAITGNRERTLFVTAPLSQTLSSSGLIVGVPASTHNGYSLSEHPGNDGRDEVQASWSEMEILASFEDDPAEFECVSEVMSKSELKEDDYEVFEQGSEADATPTALFATTSSAEDPWIGLTAIFNKEKAKKDCNEGHIFESSSRAPLAPLGEPETHTANPADDSWSEGELTPSTSNLVSEEADSTIAHNTNSKENSTQLIEVSDGVCPICIEHLSGEERWKSCKRCPIYLRQLAIEHRRVRSTVNSDEMSQ